MRFFSIHHLLHRLQRRARPDRYFVNSLRQTLMGAGYLPASRFSFWHSWKMVAASFSMILSLSAGTAVYAYTSDTVLPDHLLYPIRSTIEDAELRLARTPQEQEAIRLQQLRRRMHEVSLLSSHKRVLPLAHTKIVLRELKKISASSTVSIPDQPQVQSSTAQVYLKEILKIERRELSEIFDQQKDAQTDDDKNEVNQTLKNQVEEIDQNLNLLQRRAEHSQERKAKLHGAVTSTDSDTDENDDSLEN